MNIIVATDCGNAPKKTQLRDLVIAVVKKDQVLLEKMVTEHINWNRVGDTELVGKSAVVRELMNLITHNVSELEIHQIITHGNVGAVNGVIRFESGSNVSFCHVVGFNSFAKDALIKQITSYLITT